MSRRNEAIHLKVNIPFQKQLIINLIVVFSFTTILCVLNGYVQEQKEYAEICSIATLLILINVTSLR